MVSKVSLTAYALASCAIVVPFAAQAQASFTFDIPAQALEKSLRAVASQTNSNIVFSEAAVRGKAAPALHGSLSTMDAYRKLLQGTGLALSVTGGGSYIVGTPQSGGTPTPVATGDGSGTLLGHVAQSDGDRNIAGALVRIVETGQTTTADDSGNFRFPDLKAGQYTLEISFLGFDTLTETIAVPAGNSTSIDLALTQPGGAGAEIVVYGSRSARANALNLQRTAENNADVISADDLGNFTGTTFSDALRRAPGVSFLRDGTTGDGTNVIVRGMEPDMNAVKLNGLNLPVGNGQSRSADLSNLLADSVSKITINKSLLPSQDSSGTGGLIEIETLSPLNRPHRYVNLQVEGGKGPKGFSDDFLASGTVSGRFGAQENFGLSASVQYRRNSVQNISYNTVTKFGAFLPIPVDPTATDGQSGDAIDPLANFPFIAGDDKAYVSQVMTNFNHVKQSTLAATVSAEWQIGGHTDLKLDVQHAQSTQTSYSLTDWFSALSKYTDIPGGDAIPALNLSLAPGNAALSHEQVYAYDPDIKKTTDTYAFNGKSTFGKFTLNYLLGYAHGTEVHPRYTTLDLRRTDIDAKAEYFQPQATDPKLGYIVTPFGARNGDQIPLPLLSAAGLAYLNDPSQFTIDNGTGQIDDTTGLNDRYTANFSTRWDVDAGFLSYIEAGAHFERTTFKSNLVRTQFGGTSTVAELGLPFESMGLDKIGVNGSPFTGMSEKTLTGFLDNIDDYLAKYPDLTLLPIAPADGQDKQATKEDNYAAYVQTRLQFGKLEIIGGVRYNRTDLSATNLIFPTYIGPILPENGGGFGVDLKFQNDFSRLVTEKASSQDFLPRILFNFRQSDNLIFRGGYFISVARPRISDLSSQTRISFINIPIPGPDGVKPILTINSGNPSLKQATTHNFDLSAEYYHKIGIIKLSGFYKKINNFLQTNTVNGPANLANVTLPDSVYFKGAPYFDPAHPENYFITGGSPINSKHPATIWGVEVQVERQFDFLPGALSGLGVFANYTYTHSSRFQQYSWAYSEPAPGQIYEFGGLPFISQPKHSGTAALTYNKYGFDATLTYSFQSKSMNNFAPRGLSVYNDKVQTLDFRGEYYLSQKKFGKTRIYVEAQDLLKGTSSPDVQTLIGGYYSSATYLGGRKFKLGISTTF
jgi:TonB-dependent receptor